jgi:hypothetical protein
MHFCITSFDFDASGGSGAGFGGVKTDGSIKTQVKTDAFAYYASEIQRARGCCIECPCMLYGNTTGQA